MTSASFIWNNITEYQQKDQTSVGSHTRNRNLCQSLWQPQEVRSWHCSTVRVCAVCVQQRTYSTAICLFVCLFCWYYFHWTNAITYMINTQSYNTREFKEVFSPPTCIGHQWIEEEQLEGRSIAAKCLLYGPITELVFYCKVTLTQYILSIIFWIIKSRRLGKNLTGLHTHPSRL